MLGLSSDASSPHSGFTDLDSVTKVMMQWRAVEVYCELFRLSPWSYGEPRELYNSGRNMSTRQFEMGIPSIVLEDEQGQEAEERNLVR